MLMFRTLAAWHERIPAGKYGGVTITDVDGDGAFEVLVANATGPNRILKYADGQLREIVSPAIAAAEEATVGIIAADLDGDGTEELFALADPGRLILRGPDGRWAVLAKCGNRTVGFSLMDQRGNGRYTMASMLPTRDVELLETDEDGKLGMLGGITWTPVDSPEAEGDSIPPQCLRLDANGDGAFDKFAGLADGPHELLVLNGDEKPRNIGTPSLAFPSDLSVAIVADFDNDGFEELLLVNRGERNRLFRIAGEVTMLEAGDAAEADLNSTGAAVADLDGDGVLELIVAHEGSLGVYKSRIATGNAWLRVRPLTRFNAPARGAIVTCVVNGRTLIREVALGADNLSLNEPVAHFGLGRDPQVESVSIEWPDGEVLTLPNPDVNCTYSVPYPGG